VSHEPSGRQFQSAYQAYASNFLARIHKKGQANRTNSLKAGARLGAAIQGKRGHVKPRRTAHTLRAGMLKMLRIVCALALLALVKGGPRVQTEWLPPAFLHTPLRALRARSWLTLLRASPRGRRERLGRKTRRQIATRLLPLPLLSSFGQQHSSSAGNDGCAPGE
jgi:hypothetical protein